MKPSSQQQPRLSNRQRLSRLGGGALFLSMIALAGMNLNSQKSLDIPTEKAQVDSQMTDWHQLPKEMSAVSWGPSKTDLDGNIGRLYWGTVRERNPQYFVVTRSFNKEDFTPIGTVWNRANGEKEGESYEFLDLSLDESEMPWVFYLIKQIGTDHKVHYSDTIRARRHEESGFFMDLSLLTSGDLFVRFAADHTMDGTLKVTTSRGRVVHREEISTHYLPQSRMLDIKTWTPGTYTISLSNDEYRREQRYEIK